MTGLKATGGHSELRKDLTLKLANFHLKPSQRGHWVLVNQHWPHEMLQESMFTDQVLDFLGSPDLFPPSASHISCSSLVTWSTQDHRLGLHGSCALVMSLKTLEGC